MHLSLDDFSDVNRARCECPSGFNHSLNSWSLSDWATAFVGEAGELCNVIKKLNRVRDGIPGNKESEEELRNNLRDEIADTYTYLDLLSQAAGIDISLAVWDKFKRKSDEIGYERPISVKQANSLHHEAFVVCNGSGTPLTPFDCNPEHEEDEGMMVYRSREAAEASGRHQQNLYGVEEVTVRPLHEVLGGSEG